MTTIPLCVSTHHTSLQTALILRGLMRPDDAAEQARFSRLAAEGRHSEAKATIDAAFAKHTAHVGLLRIARGER